MPAGSDVIGAELDFQILAGRNLKPMDGTGMFKMGKASTSDPVRETVPIHDL